MRFTIILSLTVLAMLAFAEEGPLGAPAQMAGPAPEDRADPGKHYDAHSSISPKSIFVFTRPM